MDFALFDVNVKNPIEINELINTTINTGHIKGCFALETLTQTNKQDLDVYFIIWKHLNNRFQKCVIF